jgi:hypothetical protein
MIPPPRPSKTLGPGSVFPGDIWTLIAMPFVGVISFPVLVGEEITPEDDDEGNELEGAGGGGMFEPRGLIDATGGQGSCC